MTYPAPGILPKDYFDWEAARRDLLALRLSAHYLQPPAPPPAPEPEPEPMLISINAAAKRLGVRHDRVAALVASGKLPSVRIGKRDKIRPKDLEALVASGDLNPPRPGRPRSKARAPALKAPRKINLRTGRLE